MAPFVSLFFLALSVVAQSTPLPPSAKLRTPPWPPSAKLRTSPWPPSAKLRAQTLVSRMTLAQKLSLLQGSNQGTYAGTLPSIPSLGTPEFKLEDGPQGVGDGMGQVTAWPTTLTMAQSWDIPLLNTFGAAVGQEHFAKGVNVMLGPGSNIIRNPFNGRQWEYFSESEVLSAACVVAIVTGVQSNSNVSTCVKHFLGNSQEFNRNTEDALIPPRALHELYSVAFKAAAVAGAGSFMLGVNRVNGLENSANPATINLLFEDVGFEGFMVTDWAGIVVPNASAAAFAGTSVEMPKGFQYQYLSDFVANGTVPISVIDGLVTRVLTTAAALGLLDTPTDPSRGPGAQATSPAHARLARTLAARGTVLLKNSNATLPLNLTSPSLSAGILVMGDEGTVTGCGSGGVNPPYVVTPFQGLYSALTANSTRPVACTLFPDTDFFQDGVPCVTVEAGPAGNLTEACCALCTHTPTCNAWTVLPGFACPGQPASGTFGQCFLKPTTAGQRPHGGLVSGTCAPYPPTTPPLLFFPEALGDPTVAADLAKEFSAVVIVAALPVVEPDPGCEGNDRTTLALPPAYDALITAVSAVHPKVIVVTRTGGAVLMPWVESVAAVVHTGLAGQEAGSALADILLGYENPGGKLTISFPSSDTAHWLNTPEQYPGVYNATGEGFWETHYSEGLNVGYRYYATNASAPKPTFPFGHGLSYSRFDYSNLMVSGGAVNSSDPASPPVHVSLTVTNIGGPPGREVVQLYLQGPLPGDAPTLKAFEPTGLLGEGEAVTLTLSIGPSDVQYWKEASQPQGWAGYPKGGYAASIGSSSVDIRLTGVVQVVQ